MAETGLLPLPHDDGYYVQTARSLVMVSTTTPCSGFSMVACDPAERFGRNFSV